MAKFLKWCVLGFCVLVAFFIIKSGNLFGLFNSDVSGETKKEIVSDAVDQAKDSTLDKAGEIADYAKDKAPEVLEYAKDKAPEIQEDIKDKANAINEYRKESTDKNIEAVDNFIKNKNAGK